MAAKILGMQQTLGNQAVQQRASSCPAFPSACPTGGVCHTCPARVQAKLTVNTPGDQYEQEADRVAEAVMRMPNYGVAEMAGVAIKPPDLQASRRHALSLKGRDESEGQTVPPVVHEVLRWPGQPLDPEARTFMEARFGHGFSGVRVHADAKAAESAQAMNALAYTVGRDIVFAPGQYALGTPVGQRLLAHELVHVAQQTQRFSVVDTPPKMETEKSKLESEADSIPRNSLLSKGDTVRVSSIQPTLLKKDDGSSNNRIFTLTFDDGPHAAELGKGINRTEKVLDTLKAKGVKAGFFVQTGVSYRGASPVGKKLIARMHADGHKVGIHTGGTTEHELHTKAQKEGRLESELKSAKTFIEKETGEIPTLVRPPTGAFDKGVTATYSKLNLTNVLWDIDGDQGKDLSLDKLKARLDSKDAKDPGIPAIQARGWNGTTPLNPKIVVLYHDIQKGTADNLGAVIEHIKTVTNTISGGKDTVKFDAP